MFTPRAAIVLIIAGGGLLYYFRQEKKRLEEESGKFPCHAFIDSHTQSPIEKARAAATYGRPDVGGPFTLTDQHGMPFTDKDLIGDPSPMTSQLWP